tara:strand:+ start:1042 stop:1254 length:213 start_codon:yes stop_codon:yes gene_type:complete
MTLDQIIEKSKTYRIADMSGEHNIGEVMEKMRDALTRIQDLTGHNMGMSARDEACVHREASNALSPKEGS